MITRPSQAERRLGCVEPLHGILSLDKPLGFSSMKAVAIVRRRAGGARTGHAGTLDPLATGVLVLALGKCTRQIESLMATEKRYLTTIDMTAFTTTDDVEGERTEVVLGAPGARAAAPARAEIESLLAERFTGSLAPAASSSLPNRCSRIQFHRLESGTPRRLEASLPPTDSASRTASTLNSRVYCRFGTGVFLLIHSSVHQKIINILMYVEPRQGQSFDRLRTNGVKGSDLRCRRPLNLALPEVQASGSKVRVTVRPELVDGRQWRLCSQRSARPFILRQAQDERG
jgi:hypothetical protein